MDLKGDTSDGASLDSLHQVSSETGDLISHSLGGEDGDIAQNLLVEVEVSGELAVVLFDQNLGGSLDGLSSDSALRRELERGEGGVVDYHCERGCLLVLLRFNFNLEYVWIGIY